MEKNMALLRHSKHIDIEFENLMYTVKQKHGVTKDVIKGVSGKFNSGELTAIMGPSGAGKTSLLNILTGFQANGTKGTIKCGISTNSTKKKSLAYKKNSCYILQDDHLAPMFTVYETMSIACKLKIHGLTEKSMNFLIDDTLAKLGLINSKNTRCQNLSGGQKKRLSVALELVDNPPVMFLDEPTTGLDSVSSAQCVEMMKDLAREGRTIICTIHQPSASLFYLFDHVYVMAEGKCVYQGTSANVIPYLASVGFNCPQFHNPADYLLEVASGEYGNFTDLLATKATDTKWRNSINTPKENGEKVESSAIISNDDPVYPIEDNFPFRKTSPSEWTKFWILLCRQFSQLYRDWTISQLKLVLHTLVGIFLGVVFLNCGADASKVITNLGFFMCGIVYLCYTALMPAVLKFPSEIYVLRKEHFNNWYKLRTYYAAFLVSDIPLQILFSTAYTATSYFISSQPREISRFLMVLTMSCLVTLASSSLGLVYGTLVNPINGTFFGAITTCVLFSVAGFLILFTHMSSAMYILSYCSYLAFAMDGIVQAVYGFNRGTLLCPEDKVFCLYTSPKELLEYLGMDKPNYWLDIGYVFVNIVVLRLIAFFTLRRKLKS